jgi:hypothetical protein
MSPRIQGRSISRSIASPRSDITAFFDVTVNGVRVVATLPREFKAFMTAETHKWAQVVAQAGIKGE